MTSNFVLVKTLYFSWRVWEKIENKFGKNEKFRAFFIGVWLGLLPRNAFHSADQYFYDKHKRYSEYDYNKRGLFDWERKVVETYIRNRENLLISSVGGGREIYALRKMGFKAQGFECNPDFVKSANLFLTKEGMTPDIRKAEWDLCPDYSQQFDGLIVGWGSYTLIPGHHARVRFLKQLRALVNQGDPLLVSFFCRSNKTHPRFRTARKVGNAIRRILRRELLDEGDYLVPSYAHYFSPDQITQELKECGFEIQFFSTEEYGHAVAFAV